MRVVKLTKYAGGKGVEDIHSHSFNPATPDYGFASRRIRIWRLWAHHIGWIA